MSRAVMEGVAFALRDCLEVAKSNGVTPTKATICGGGAKSKTWQQIIADVLNLPLNISDNKQGVAFGAAVLAMVASGEYKDVNSACSAVLNKGTTLFPNQDAAEKYNIKYGKFRKIYPAIKEQ